MPPRADRMCLGGRGGGELEPFRLMYSVSARVARGGARRKSIFKYVSLPRPPLVSRFSFSLLSDPPDLAAIIAETERSDSSGSLQRFAGRAAAESAGERNTLLEPIDEGDSGERSSASSSFSDRLPERRRDLLPTGMGAVLLLFMSELDFTIGCGG